VLFGCYLCCSVVICVALLLFVLFYVLFVCKCVLPPGDNPIAVNKYIISFGTTVRNTEMELEQIECEGVVWIDLAHNTAKWKTLPNPMCRLAERLQVLKERGH
jgi:hypothetical protein